MKGKELRAVRMLVADGADPPKLMAGDAALEACREFFFQSLKRSSEVQRRHHFVAQQRALAPTSFAARPHKI